MRADGYCITHRHDICTTTSNALCDYKPVVVLSDSHVTPPACVEAEAYRSAYHDFQHSVSSDRTSAPFYKIAETTTTRAENKPSDTKHTTSPLYYVVTGAEPNVGDDDGRTPAHYAASNGRREVVAVLLEFGGDISAVDRELDTPLHCATRGRQRLVMSLLESAGADPEARNCWGDLAGTLAPGYKMNPVLHDDDNNGDAIIP